MGATTLQSTRQAVASRRRCCRGRAAPGQGTVPRGRWALHTRRRIDWTRACTSAASHWTADASSAPGSQSAAAAATTGGLTDPRQIAPSRQRGVARAVPGVPGRRRSTSTATRPPPSREQVPGTGDTQSATATLAAAAAAAAANSVIPRACPRPPHHAAGRPETSAPIMASTPEPGLEGRERGQRWGRGWGWGCQGAGVTLHL